MRGLPSQCNSSGLLDENVVFLSDKYWLIIDMGQATSLISERSKVHDLPNLSVLDCRIVNITKQQSVALTKSMSLKCNDLGPCFLNGPVVNLPMYRNPKMSS